MVGHKGEEGKKGWRGSLSSLFYPGRKLERGKEKEDQEKGSSYFLLLLFFQPVPLFHPVILPTLLFESVRVKFDISA